MVGTETADNRAHLLREKYIFIQQVQAYRLFVGDKMNFMAAFGQCDTQFCGHNTTSTKRWDSKQ